MNKSSLTPSHLTYLFFMFSQQVSMFLFLFFVFCFFYVVMIPCCLEWPCNPMDYSPPGSSVHGIPGQEYWSGLPFPFPGDLPDPGIKPKSPALAGRFFTTEPPGKPLQVGQNPIFFTDLDSFPSLQTRSVASSICDPTKFAQIKYYYRRAWFMAHGKC